MGMWTASLQEIIDNLERGLVDEAKDKAIKHKQHIMNNVDAAKAGTLKSNLSNFLQWHHESIDLLEAGNHEAALRKMQLALDSLKDFNAGVSELVHDEKILLLQ